jgi:hypothetical protein
MRDRPERESAPATAAGIDHEVSAERPGGTTSLTEMAAAGGVEGETASELAYESEDENVKELKSKVGTLVDGEFGGDYKKAFDHYDSDRDGGIHKAELVALLKDAGVGNGFTRGAWASGIIERLDKSTDEQIQWAEFESVFRAMV